jgi:hypothetical protein
MRNPLILAWWLILLTALQVAALILDRFHHLEWGRLGMHLIKAGYLGFALVLFIRFLSFRSQKAFESLVENYNRVAKQAFEAEKAKRNSWVNPFWLLAMVVLATLDFAIVFNWNVTVFKISVILDLLVWLLAMRWVVRTYWLKSQGTRERLKEVLDDARSRLKAQDAEPQIAPKRVSKAPFATLAALALAAAAVISLYRWSEVREAFRVDDLKACMDKCMRMASVRFYQHGEMEIQVAGEPCVLSRAGHLDFTMDLHKSNLYLRAYENDTSDYFGDGTVGNEGLVLDVNGHFRRAWTPSAVPDDRPISEQE